MMISSPFSKKARVSPFGKVKGSCVWEADVSTVKIDA
jgi:hypothetical protein